MAAGASLVLSVVAAPFASADHDAPVCVVNGTPTNGTLQVNDVHLITGTLGNDVITCQTTSHQDEDAAILLNTLDGDDNVTFGGVNSRSTVNLGPGDDTMFTIIQASFANGRKASNEGTLNGGPGNDTIKVGLPVDQGFLNGDGNNGTVNGGLGNDTITLYGGSFNDSFSIANIEPGVVSGGGGADTISLFGGQTGIDDCGAAANTGIVNGGDGADTIRLTGGESATDTCFNRLGRAANDDDPDAGLGQVNGNAGLDKIYLTSGSSLAGQEPSNRGEATVNGGLNGAVCVFSPAPENPAFVTNCTTP
ncbi:hypothetical protein M8C13_38510 [Crossiella sp. SN42]|uniref:hypothetical protein n=1 Tax=Crossiella sp. SN42 TaxID=2944808 RepID=UPI00207CFF58|nr:hypothetical protein [Crossiella sp. SN42]MCO1581658.1 hypothetical protein [Crossiella sp. SN42]